MKTLDLTDKCLSVCSAVLFGHYAFGLVGQF